MTMNRPRSCPFPPIRFPVLYQRCLVLLLAAVAVLAAGCQAPPRTAGLAKIDQQQGYRLNVHEKASRDPLPETYMVASFSGGGTRAAALALGALRALEETYVIGRGGQQVRLLDALDMVSSVSGGSVTAAHFGLYGRQGFGTLEDGFLRKDVQGKLILKAVNPVTWVRLATPSYARIDALIDYFDANVFAGATYADLEEAAKGDHRPFVVLNAADMDTGSVFSFTQDQFDLICSDLEKFPIADAVGSSAAFPVALTAVTLKNRAPCEAQAAAPDDFFSGWQRTPEGAAPSGLVQAVDRSNIGPNPGRFRYGRQKMSFLNQTGAKDYVQLLDGGIADNLGLTYPLLLFTDPNQPGSVRARINLGEISRAAFIVVNARSDAEKSIGKSPTPPGIFTTLGTVIGTPIDGSSFLLLDKLQESVAETETGTEVVTFVIAVDFDFIEDPGCRRDFKDIGTTWALPGDEISALLRLGRAMVQQSPKFKELVRELGGVPPTDATVESACALLADREA